MNSSNIYYPLSGLINAITSVILGIFVLSKNRTNVKHVTYALFCLCMAIWSGFYFLWLITDNKELALLYCHGLMAGAIFIPSVYLHHILALLNLNLKKRPLIFASYLVTIIFSVLNFTPYFISNVQPRLSFKYWPTAGPFFSIFLLIWAFIAIYGVYELLKAYKRFVGAERDVIRHVLIGTVIGWVGGGSNFFLWYGIPILPIFNISISFYMILIAYAIVRHKLMNIEVIIKKTLVFTLLFIAVYAVFATVTFLFQVIIERLTGVSTWLSMVPSITLIVLILRPLENFLRGTTDKYLFQKKYDYKELLKTFTTEVLTVLDKDVLVHTTVDKLANIIKIQSCGILLENKVKNQYELLASIGIDRNWQNMALKMDNTLTTFLARTRTYLSIKHQGKDSPIPVRIIEDMNKLKMEMAIPLVIHEDMIGILTLGKKKSDEDYTQDDMDIILPLARTLAIAISNAMALDELAKTQAEATQREKMAVIGTLSAGINHEICNPLGIARGQCEAFLLNMKDGLYKNKTSEELLEKAQSIMNKVIHETDRATAITKRLSSFAKPSKGIISDDINIKSEIDEVLALVSYELKLDKINIVNEIDDSMPCISGDKKQLQEVFFNLIRNAAQAIIERGKITVRAKKHNDNILIEIEDTGQGIAEDKIDQIFNPFFTTKDPGKGTGLGLFIVRQVVERNRGRISVRSKLGEGTTFSLEFPAETKEMV